MLMVIFGAGASYDSVPSRPPGKCKSQCRLPLAKDLFADRPLFNEKMKRVPRCLDLIPYLRVANANVTVEQTLARFQGEAAEYAERHKQLAAIRYYLHFMIRACQSEWEDEAASGATNYLTLLDQIDHWGKRGEQVGLVTFNYDTLLEAALLRRGFAFRSLTDYIAPTQRFTVFKVHGSVNWARMMAPPFEGNGLGGVNEVINLAQQLKVSDNYVMLNDGEQAIMHYHVSYPAIAIPVETKKDFECPEEHVGTLRETLHKVTKLLVIGWRATEIPFLDLLKSELNKPIPAMVVAESEQQAQEPMAKLNGVGIVAHQRAARFGFTEFITTREGEDFLRS